MTRKIHALTQKLVRCRHQSTSARPTPPAEISSWIERMRSRPVEETTEIFDPLRANQLVQTLPTRLRETKSYLSLPEISTLPKSHHLVYFQPDSNFTQLGEDGSSTEYNAPAPYLRRMWAGGSFEWPTESSHAIRTNEPVLQRTIVESVDFKKDMIFVNQQRVLSRASASDAGEAGVFGVKEIRTHVFRRDVSGNDSVKDRATQEVKSSASPAITHSFTSTPTAPLLFRYSALTYNAHRIHYDRDWCKSVEGHPDLVVHGPLTATLLVELAEKVAQTTGRQLRKFEYRATSPMYVDREITYSAMAGGGDGIKVELMATQEGRIGMKAVATFE